MRARRRSGFAAAAVSLAVVALVVLDVTDDAVRAWWTDHAFTAAVVTGLLVLAVTVLVVDQVNDLRTARSHARAVAAQAAIVLAQALRSGETLDAALSGSGARDAAADDVRNYLTMLLVSGPVLIETTRARAFLEQAQLLGATMTRALGGSASAERVAEETQRLRDVAHPVLDVLHPAERAAATGEGDRGNDS